MLNVLTFNAAIQDVRLFGYSFYCPVPFIKQRLAKLAEALLKSDADVIFLQELFHRKQQKKLYQLVKASYPYLAEISPFKIENRLGNGQLILTKFPITIHQHNRFEVAAHKELKHASMGFMHAQIKLAKLGLIDLINFHTTGGGGSYHPESEAMENIRKRQINQMLEYAQGLKYVVLAGDLNAGPQTSHPNYQQFLKAGYKDTAAALDPQAMTWDPNNPLVLDGLEPELPAQRIDHIFLNACLAQRLETTRSEIIFTEAQVKVADRHIPLSDHYALFTQLEER